MLLELLKNQTEEFSVGDEVIVTGYDLGMNTDGGFGEYISVPSEWVVKKPPNFIAGRKHDVWHSRLHRSIIRI